MKTKLLILLLLLPVFCNAGVSGGPSNLSFPDQIFKLGEKYELVGNNGEQFFITHDESGIKEFEVEIGCIDQKKCPNKEFFVFTPKTFTLNQYQVQKIKIEMILPRDADEKESFGEYEFFILAKGKKVENPLLSNETSGQSTINLAIGSLVRLKIAGKIPIHKAAMYWLQDKIGKPMLASVAGIFEVIPPPIFAIVAISIFILMLLKLVISKIRHKRKLSSVMTFNEFNQLNDREQEQYLEQAGDEAKGLILECVERVLELCPNPSDRELSYLPKRIARAVREKKGLRIF